MQVLTVPFKSRHQGSGHPPPQGSASERSEIDRVVTSATLSLRGHIRDSIESSIHNHVHSCTCTLLAEIVSRSLRSVSSPIPGRGHSNRTARHRQKKYREVPIYMVHHGTYISSTMQNISIRSAVDTVYLQAGGHTASMLCRNELPESHDILKHGSLKRLCFLSSEYIMCQNHTKYACSADAQPLSSGYLPVSSLEVGFNEYL